MTIERNGAHTLPIAGLAIDFWKLLRVAERLAEGLPEERRRRAEAQLRFSSGRLESHLQQLNASLVTFQGQRFGAELPAVAVNADDFASSSELFIESAVEPAVIVDGKVVQNARVMLREGNDDVPRD